MELLLFDHTLKPYPRAWLLRSCFVENEPQVHIGVLDGEQKSIIWNDVLSGRAEMSHFYWKPNCGDSITLEVSSNCNEVELIQNGKSLGIKKMIILMIRLKISFYGEKYRGNRAK